MKSKLILLLAISPLLSGCFLGWLASPVPDPVIKYEVLICPSIDPSLNCKTRWADMVDLDTPPDQVLPLEQRKQYGFLRVIIECDRMEDEIRAEEIAACRNFKQEQGSSP